MAPHPDLAAEQAYIDHAYACLESSRRGGHPPDVDGRGRPGRHRAGPVRARGHLRHGRQPARPSSSWATPRSCFGRIDRVAESPDGATESFYIGRIAVSDSRAGARRRRLAGPGGRAVLPGHRPPAHGPGPPPPLRHPRPPAARHRGRAVRRHPRRPGPAAATREARQVTGQGALFTALEAARTGRLGDIVATIQGEQDEIIRAPLPGVLVVQGGPGTGKTVVALHRAAYLLYTHRFPLEGQGVLVDRPQSAVPRLHRAGAAVAGRGRRRAGRARPTSSPDVSVRGLRPRPHRPGQGRPPDGPLPRPGRPRPSSGRCAPTSSSGYGLQRLTPHPRAQRPHRGRRPAPLPAPQPGPPHRRERGVRRAGAVEPQRRPGRRPRSASACATTRRSARRSSGCGRCSRRPSCCTTSSAARPCCATPAATSSTTASGWRCTGPAPTCSTTWPGPTRTRRCSTRPGRCSAPSRSAAAPASRSTTTRSAPTATSWSTRPRTSHPMQLRMLERRSLNGSMTVVGDIAQATGQWAHQSWDEILDLLPQKRPARRTELTLGYRLPAPIMDLASRVLRHAAPDMRPPRSVREDGAEPTLRRAAPGGLAAEVVAATSTSSAAVEPGQVAVIVPPSVIDDVCAALDDAGVSFGRATRNGLEHRVTVVEVGLVKGLEVDAAVVVEPAAHGRRGSAGRSRPLRRPHPGHQAPLGRPRARPPTVPPPLALGPDHPPPEAGSPGCGNRTVLSHLSAGWVEVRPRGSGRGRAGGRSPGSPCAGRSPRPSGRPADRPRRRPARSRGR